MKKLNLEKCDNLADVFCALMGGIPEDIREIEAFMAQSPLNSLIKAADMNRIINYDGFFSDEVVDAVYALLPVKLQISPTRKWIMTPQAFRKLNAAQVNKPASRFISVSIPFDTYILQFNDKVTKVIQAIKDAKEAMEKAKLQTKIDAIDAQLQKIKEWRASKYTPEAKRKELKKEANRLQTAKYRLLHPDAWKKSYKKISELPPEKQEERRAANRRRNDTFRDTHRKELRVYHNKRRAQEKTENPEAVKEKDKKHNSSAEAKATKRRYCQKHAKKIAKKAKKNPMTKVYKQRSAAKKRFREKTSPMIFSLLQGIINSKIK